MAPSSTLHFGPFALDGTDDGLWCGSERCTLTAKAEAVLRLLIAPPRPPGTQSRPPGSRLAGRAC
jgi:hypothetical protein